MRMTLFLIVIATIVSSVLNYYGYIPFYKRKQSVQTKWIVQKCDSVGNPIFTNITIFHPNKKECGDFPNTCADGFEIYINKPERVLAMSLDLQKKYGFSYKNLVWVEIPDAPYLNGIYTLHTTNGAYNNIVEILIYNPVICKVEGSWKGTISHYYKN